MPEIKHSFTGGKMNKDLDERLVANGQYTHAMNVQVSTSEGSDVGTIQNLLGNHKHFQNDTIIPDNRVCIGSIADEKNDALYWFVASTSAISPNFIMQNPTQIGISLSNLASQQGQIQSNYFRQALTGLDKAKSTLDKSLGQKMKLPTLEAKRTTEQVGEIGGKEMEKTRETLEQTAGSTNLATIELDDQVIKDVRDKYTTKVEDIDIALTKNLSEILSDFERQKYEMAAQRDQIEMQKKLADKQSQSKYFGLFG